MSLSEKIVSTGGQATAPLCHIQFKCPQNACLDIAKNQTLRLVLAVPPAEMGATQALVKRMYPPTKQLMVIKDIMHVLPNFLDAYSSMFDKNKNPSTVPNEIYYQDSCQLGLYDPVGQQQEGDCIEQSEQARRGKGEVGIAL